MKLRPVVLLVVAGLITAGCGGGNGETDTSSGLTEEAAANIPAFDVTQPPDDGDGPGYVTVAVRSTKDLRAVFDEVRSRYDDERGYHVLIECDEDRDARNVLGNGKFANGSRGAAQTGLPADGAEFTAVDGATCPSNRSTDADQRDAEEREKLFEKVAREEARDFESGRLTVDRAMSARVARLLVKRCDHGRPVPSDVCAKARSEAAER